MIDRRSDRVLVVRFAVIIVLMVGMLASPAMAAGRKVAPAKASQAPKLVALNQIHVLGGRPAPFALDARAAMLIAARTGTVLYAYNEHERMEPASLAKMMTFYLVLKALHDGKISLDTKVPISKKAWRLAMDPDVSRMFLRVGQQVPVRKLLYGLMVSSGNDAAVALAQYLGGSTEAFAQQMNEAAKQLGLADTHFENPNGLPEPGEYTTAADMVKLAHAVSERYPDAFTYTSTKEFTYDKIRQPNFNSLLFYDRRVDGFKTGHVEVAGYHLVATARTPSIQLISAVMGTPSALKRRTQTEKLLDWAFRTFVTVSPDWHKVIPSSLPVYEGKVSKVAVAPEQTPYVTVVKGEENKLSIVASLKSKYLVAPIFKHQPVGDLTVSVNGKPQASIPILAEESVGQGGLARRLIDRARMML